MAAHGEHGLDFSTYEAIYKDLHANPGLTTQETFAASTVLKHLAQLDELLEDGKKLSVHDKIGGHGVAAVLHNGTGHKILLRADTDALPVEEKTGLPYASKHSEIDPFSQRETRTMHACGHDMHTTCLLAAAERLIRNKHECQRKSAIGARAMVDDGLYDKVPVPDIVLGQHVWPYRVGQVSLSPGTWMAATDSFKITLFGRGGHGSMPHNCIDPVLLAAHVIVRLQDIVSREVNPSESAVLTVGSVQAGEAENIIPAFAILKVNIRSQSEGSRKRVLSALKRIVKGECQASGCEKEPLFEQTVEAPMTVNDKAVTEKVMRTFEKRFEDDFLSKNAAVNASEDVSILATSINKPYCFWFWGGTDAEKWDKAAREHRLLEDIPVNHSPFFAPAIQPTMTIGAETLYLAALTFLGKESS